LWSEPDTRRRALVALGLLGALAACGFSPVYAPGAPATRLRGEVLPDPPGTRYGFRFVAQVEDRLGRASNDAAYRLAYTLPRANERSAVTGTGGALRRTLEGAAEYRLIARGRGQVLTSGRVTGFTSFTDIGTSVAVRTARAAAEERLAVILADQVATRLIASAPDWA